MSDHVTEMHWGTLEAFRQAVDKMFAEEVLPFPDKLVSYDKVIASGREALEGRGIDLDDEGQVYIVSSVVSWMANLAAGITHARCGDPHVIAHLKEALQWPAFMVREMTINIPLAEKEAGEPDGE